MCTYSCFFFSIHIYIYIFFFLLEEFFRVFRCETRRIIRRGSAGGRRGWCIIAFFFRRSIRDDGRRKWYLNISRRHYCNNIRHVANIATDAIAYGQGRRLDGGAIRIEKKNWVPKRFFGAHTSVVFAEGGDMEYCPTSLGRFSTGCNRVIFGQKLTKLEKKSHPEIVRISNSVRLRVRWK